jgi:Carboxypeptidase regulatory-like domain
MASPKNLFFFLLFLPVSLYAKTGIGKVEGVLNGYVTDAVTKKPLPGVVVSAKVPGTNRQQEVLTDSDGYFRFVELPAVQVTLEFNKKGYRSFKRPNVSVKEKAPVQLNIEFLPAQVDADSPNSEYPVLRLLQAS